jgi:antitoxin Phd
MARGMREIPLSDVEPTLAELVDDVLRGEEFAITRDGRKEAVVISWATWRRLATAPSFGRLLAGSPIEDGDIADATACFSETSIYRAFCI